MKEVIFRVTLDRSDEAQHFTLSDYMRFTREAEEFNIPPDTPIGVTPSSDFGYGPLMVQRIAAVSEV